MNDVLWVLTDACYRGKLKEVIHLLSGDHVDVNEFFKVPRLDVQWTPLTSAAMGGQTTLVKILINRYGARVDNPNTGGMTALTAAAFAGFPETCQILLDHGANIEAPGLRGETALIGAASGGHGTTVDLLMKHGANLEAVDNDGRTALMKAAKFGCTGTVDLLVTRYGADCSVKDKDGMTAQMVAAEAGNEDAAKLIGTLSTCPQIFTARKTLDDLYKKVEAALDRQLASETKMDELTRQLCEEDKVTLEKKKETSIEKHIESEDLLVDYQRRLMEAAGGGEAEMLALFKEAVKIVEENTGQAEAEMLSFVDLVEDFADKLDRYAAIKEELNAIKQRIFAEKHIMMVGIDQYKPQSAQFSALLGILQLWVAGGGDGGSGQADGDRVTRRDPERKEALHGSALMKEFEECEKEMSSSTKTKAIAEFLPRLEACLESLKSVDEQLDRMDLEFSSHVGKKAVGPENRVAPPDVANGANGAADADNAPTDKVCAAVKKDGTGPSSIRSSIAAMGASQVLGLLEIRMDSEAYTTRAPRRSHRWQMTKRSSAERSAERSAGLNTAEKIADLLQKSKLEPKQ